MHSNSEMLPHQTIVITKKKFAVDPIQTFESLTELESSGQKLDDCTSSLVVSGHG